MIHVLLDRVVETDHGQFDPPGERAYLGFDGDFDAVFDGRVNGLAGAASSGGLYLHFARRSGGSPVRIVLLDHAPALDDRWEGVVEVSTTIPDGGWPQWTSWAGETGGSLDLPPGTYRVRVNARGRDAGHDGEFSGVPVDFYLVEFWPAPFRPDAVLRVSSEDAEYWHREVGSRRDPASDPVREPTDR